MSAREALPTALAFGSRADPRLREAATVGALLLVALVSYVAFGR